MQEHKLLERQIGQASAWARAKGWKSLWGAAAIANEHVGDHSRSGGVGLFVREDLGLMEGPVVAGEWGHRLLFG